MKKIALALLMTLAVNNAFEICAGGETLESQKPTIEENIQKDQDQVQSTSKKDILKGFAGLGLAGLFGYLAYSCGNKSVAHYELTHYYDKLQTITESFYKHGPQRIFQLIPDSTAKKFFKKNLGLIINGLIASECARYGIKKLSPIIAEKTPAIVKNKLSSTYSAMTNEIQALGSWIKNKFKAKSAQ